jgi:hypothetical protein
VALILLLCLFPLASYCLFLAFVNRSRHPVLVRGTWDFAGVLLALSGFLVLGGPAILNGLYGERRVAWVLGGRGHFLPGLDQHEWYLWAVVWLSYYFGLIAGSAYLLWRRRRLLSIYNIDPEQFDRLLAAALRGLGLGGLRMGSRVVIEGLGRGPSEALPVDPADGTGPTTVAVLEVEPFTAMRHISLAWLDDRSSIQREIEIELEKVLAEAPPARESVAGWFLAFALSLYCVTIAGALLLIVAVVYRIVR